MSKFMMRMGLLVLAISIASGGSLSMAMMGGTVAGTGVHPENKEVNKANSEVNKEEASEVNKEVAPEVNKEVASEVNKEEASEVNKEEAPEVNKEVAPEVNKEEAPEVNKEEAPEVNKEEAPEVNKEEAPEVNKEEAPEVNKEVAPEVNKEVAPEVKEKAAPEVKEVSVSDLEEDVGQEEVKSTEKKLSLKLRILGSMIRFLEGIRGEYFGPAETKWQKVCNIFLSSLNWAYEKCGGESQCDKIESFQEACSNLKDLEISIKSNGLEANLKEELAKIKSGDYNAQDIATLKNLMEQEKDAEQKVKLEALVKYAEARENLKSIAKKAQDVADEPVVVKAKKIKVSAQSKLTSGLFFQEDYDEIEGLLKEVKTPKEKINLRKILLLGSYQIKQRGDLKKQEENEEEMKKIASEYEDNNSLSIFIEKANKFSAYDKDAIDSSSFDTAFKQLKKERAVAVNGMKRLYNENKKIDRRLDPFLKGAFKAQSAR